MHKDIFSNASYALRTRDSATAVLLPSFGLSCALSTSRALHACLIGPLGRVILLHTPSINLSQCCRRARISPRIRSSILLLQHSSALCPPQYILLTYLRRRPHGPHHALQQLHPRNLSRLPEPNAHVL
jgi:hypothetical protein